MSALDLLADLLRRSVGTGAKSLRADVSIDAVIAQLERHTRSGAAAAVPGDLQAQAIRRFWDAQKLETLRDARLISFGLCVPCRPAGPSIMEDRKRFQAVLDRQTGVDQWLDDPRCYRRCYQGLMRSYFTYDAQIDSAPAVGRQNWGDLRDHLHDRVHKIVDKTRNQDWVTTAVDNRQLFGADPCTPYAAALLDGDTSAVDHVCEQLGVVKASWFLRELVFAQVRKATTLGHERFKALIPTLLRLFGGNHALRDRCLIRVLDKYASVAQPGIDDLLRNAAVEWWGNPWLPSNAMRWGGVSQKAREMVSEWLKREFIEAFFAKLAEDGVGDRRRANFWLRYVKCMDNVQFALGARALCSDDRDFVALRRKMAGLYTELKTTDSSNNAFVMTMGPLVAVEFGGMGNAFYGYDSRDALPFDLSQPVATAKNVRNSLKHSERMLWMQHQDGIRGWDKWEDMFEATLKQQFDLKPTSLRQPPQNRTAAPPPPTSPSSLHKPRPAHRATNRTGNAVSPFSMTSLMSLAQASDLTVHDLRAINGNLWVRTDDRDTHVNQVLVDWQFTYRHGKGWWR